MKKNVWKRHAALALIGTMAIGSLYGCGNKSTTSDPTQATTGNSTDGTSSDGKEKLVIALQTYSFITDYDNNYLTKLLEDKLGIDIEFYLLSADSSEATTQLSLMVSAGEQMPDIIWSRARLWHLILFHMKLPPINPVIQSILCRSGQTGTGRGGKEILVNQSELW